MYRKVKVGATVGGIGAVAATVLSVFHVHIPPELLAFVPAFIAWATHFFASYEVREPAKQTYQKTVAVDSALHQPTEPDV